MKDDQVERWARYVRSHPEWKAHMKPFIDSQIEMANRFYSRLSKAPGGREKVKALRDAGRKT